MRVSDKSGRPSLQRTTVTLTTRQLPAVLFATREKAASDSEIVESRDLNRLQFSLVHVSKRELDESEPAMKSIESLMQTIISRLETILRRDLKLGPDVAIEPDMPLLGGDYDLDSLDVLLLLTSIEKEFRIKIPSEDVRRDSFKNLDALAQFVEQRIAQSQS